MNNELSINFIKQLEELQNMLIKSNDDEVYGDGKTLVNNEEFPITMVSAFIFI